VIRDVKRFASKKFIHTIDLGLLRRFLEPYRGKISLDFDTLDKDSEKTRKRLYEYLLAADESYPAQMLDDLHRIAELSTEVGVAHLRHRAELAGVEIIPADELGNDDGLRFNPRYLALRAFLDHPDVFESALDWLGFDDHQSPAEFVGADEDVKPHVGKAARDAFEQQAGEFFNARYQGRYCKARLYEDEDGVNILVIHGKQPVSTLVIVEDQERPLTFRETKQDTLTYDQATGRLKVTARTEEEKQRLCAIFATTILGKPKFFDHGDCRRLYTLDPIAKAGADFRLDGAWDPDLVEAAVVEIQFYNQPRGGWVMTIRDAKDAIARLYEKCPDTDLAETEINYVRLRFTFLLNGKKRKRTVKIKPPSLASFDRASLEDKVMEHLKRNGFCLSRRAAAAAA
jgi:hypothetical protein